MKIKDDFHHLIDEINDEKLLQEYYNLIQRLSDNQSGQLWNMLTNEQKEELLLAYDESFDPANLVSHEDVKMQHEKWLKREWNFLGTTEFEHNVDQTNIRDIAYEQGMINTK